MLRPVQRIPEARLRADYPIQRSPEGWYFRMTETSAGAWLVEGTDAWGRKVARDGTDPEALLELCELDARSIPPLSGT